jgi:hypothetical protein
MRGNACEVLEHCVAAEGRIDSPAILVRDECDDSPVPAVDAGTDITTRNELLHDDRAIVDAPRLRGGVATVENDQSPVRTQAAGLCYDRICQTAR